MQKNLWKNFIVDRKAHSSQLFRITRLSALFLFLFVVESLASMAFSQNQKISMSKPTATIAEVINLIEQQTDYLFVYDKHEVDLTKKVAVGTAQKTVANVLEQVSKMFGLSYTIEGKHIILNKQNPNESRTNSKTIRVSGKVKEMNNEPIIGCNVQIKGTSHGTITNIDGEYSLEMPSDAILTFSYLGYLTQEQLVKGRTTINVTLKEDAKALEEVVVIGYGSMKKKDITTAVSVVSTADIEERPLVSAAQALQGKAAGIQVIQPSGKPGASMSIRVRGATSVQADNEPLYVIDGIPSGDISNISPNDIESMQVLKDASSAAIYGARAANGVVLITTKRGKAGIPVVKFSTYAGISQLGNKLDALNTEQYKDLMKDLRKTLPSTPIIPDEETRYTDWTKLFFKNGLNQSYQLSVANGNEKLQYFVSAGLMSEEGIVEKANFKRYNFRANIDSEQTSWLKMGLNISYAHTTGREVYESRSSMRSGSILSVINTPPFMQTWSPNNPSVYDEDAYGARIANPMAANAADRNSSKDRLVGSFNATIKLFKGLSFKSNFGIDLTNDKSNYFLDPVSSADGRSSKGRVEEGFSRNFEWLFENILTYDRSFKHHNLSLLGGSIIQNATYAGGNIAGFDLLASYPNIRTVSAANQLDKDATWSSATEWSLASFIGRAAYNYDSRYLITANVRSDGSSRFAPGKRWGIFPSVSAGWRISGEEFMRPTENVITDLKLRGGWGINGNQGGIGNYDYLAYYYANKVAPTTENQLPGLALSPKSAANTDLTWEKTTQYNVGVDLSLYNSRLQFTADFYYKYTNDLLLTLSLPDNVNLPGGITRNDGEMENKGMEFAVSSQNFVGEFKWSTDFNISFNKNKLTKLGLNKVYYYADMYETKQSSIILKEGLPLGTFYGYISHGVDPETGDIVYEDRNENGIIDPEDRTTIGCAQPDFIYGLTNNFSYKGFDLSVFFQGSQGNDIFNASRIDMESMMDFRNQSVAVLNRWVRPGMETSIPRVGNIQNINNSTRFIEDGSYLRLKSITLSYNFPSTWLKKIHLSKLQPYITGQNLLTFTKYKGYDPEVNAYGGNSVAMGVDYGTYPQSKAVIFGLNVEF